MKKKTKEARLDENIDKAIKKENEENTNETKPEADVVENSTDEVLPDPVAELTDRLQRTMAEFDNFRKRTVKEKSAMFDMGVKDTIEKFLPVIDNFERAIQYADVKEGSFYKGVEMILRQLESALDFIGVEVIDACGKTFDPNIHNAVAHVEDESLGENEVVEVLQKGYRYKGTLIRPSMVKVAN